MNKFFQDCRGSASLEFVLLAIPLFIPIFIFMNNYSDVSDVQTSLRSLARESVRVFVTSENDQVANLVLSEVIAEGAHALGLQNSVQYSVRCSQSPCIYPNGRVEVTVLGRLKNSKEVEVTAIEYVSPWS